MIENNRISDALSWSRKEIAPFSDSPALDSQLLLSHAVGREKSWILSHPEFLLNDATVTSFQHNVQRYKNGEALPHILGRWEFYGRNFQLSPNVLIPRPETELVVEASLEILNRLPTGSRVADVGTGSGCIAITVALESPDCRVVAMDISLEALAVARQNAQDHDVLERVSFVQSDLAMPFAPRFGLVIANLPYIPSWTLDELPVGEREPRIALDGGESGIEVIERFLIGLPRVLTRPGGAVLEIGEEQGEGLSQMAKMMIPDSVVEVRKDLAGFERIVIIET